MRDTVRNYSIGTFSRGSPIVFFVWGLPYSSNRHVTPVSVRGRKGLTCSIRAPPRPRFDTVRQSVSNRAQLFLAVYVPKGSRDHNVDCGKRSITLLIPLACIIHRCTDQQGVVAMLGVAQYQL